MFELKGQLVIRAMQGSAGEQGKMPGEGRWLDTQSLGKKRKIMRLEEAE